MVDERMAKLQYKQPQTSEWKKIFADGLVCAVIECILDRTNTFIPILICYTRGHCKTIFHHWGTNCVDLFIQTLLQWAEEEKYKDGGAPELHIFFHNLKGFDGVLIMNTLYKQNLKVTDNMGTGTKMLHFKHKNLIFKDSLSFLNMPVTNFTKTFGLTELKKGWFPHKFSMNPSVWMRRRKPLVKIGMQSKWRRERFGTFNKSCSAIVRVTSNCSKKVVSNLQKTPNRMQSLTPRLSVSPLHPPPTIFGVIIRWNLKRLQWNHLMGGVG